MCNHRCFLEIRAAAAAALTKGGGAQNAISAHWSGKSSAGSRRVDDDAVSPGLWARVVGGWVREGEE